MTDQINENLLAKHNGEANAGFTKEEIRDVLLKPMVLVDYAQQITGELNKKTYKHRKKQMYSKLTKSLKEYFDELFRGMNLDQQCEVTDYMDDMQAYLDKHKDIFFLAFDNCFMAFDVEVRKELSRLSLINTLCYMAFRMVKAISRRDDPRLWGAIHASREIAEIILAKDVKEIVPDQAEKQLQLASDVFVKKMIEYKGHVKQEDIV